MTIFNVGDTIRILTTAFKTPFDLYQICSIEYIKFNSLLICVNDKRMWIFQNQENVAFERHGSPNDGQPVSTLVPAQIVAPKETYNWTEICNSLWDKYTLD